MDTSNLAPKALALLRIVTALLFIEHATVKFFAFPTPFQLPGPLPPLLVGAGVIELIAGTLILLGLFTRPAAFIASGEMAIGYFLQHATKGFWPVANGGEAAILFCFIFLFIAAEGPGAWALDNARGRKAVDAT